VSFPALAAARKLVRPPKARSLEPPALWVELLLYLPRQGSFLEQAAPSARSLEPKWMEKIVNWIEPPRRWPVPTPILPASMLSSS
jgi:hypothetical protein